MTPDAFPRLALVAACTAYTVALVVVGQQLGWAAAAAGLVGGALLALALSVEQEPPGIKLNEREAKSLLALDNLTATEIEAILNERIRRGDVPVATRRGRPLAGAAEDN